MNVGLRVDASPSIGLGHVQRCLSLAHALREHGADVHFVTRQLGIDVEAMSTAAGFPCKLLCRGNVGLEWSIDADNTVAALGSVAIDWLVVDHYDLDARWQSRAGAALNARVAVIDDLGDRKLAAQLLIDHNYAADHRAKYGDQIDEQTLVLGGPRYALLGPAYANHASYAFSENVRSIGIFMGGTDSGNFSALALRACRDAAKFYGPVEVATTHSNPNLEPLKTVATRWPDTKICVDLPNLAEFFARHDLQIGAGGGATWERCCIGVPTLAILVAENQRHVLDPLRVLGVVHAVTDNPLSEELLGREIRHLIDTPAVRRQLARQGRALVDGRGALRVADVMKGLCTK